ncbi:MAG: DUF1517 domain-containing protein [Myxococcales bacterium]|nr:DUF1517 domain-containing protein [Myxococcales bacterium]
MWGERAAARSQRVTEAAAERQLVALVSELKARYRHDVTRGDPGPAGLCARAEEGEGLVVVSFVVGTTRPLPPLPGALDRDALQGGLADAVATDPHSFVALEVIWSPALEQDRMSSAELEALYPELTRLGVGPLGRVSCGACGVVFAAELGQCPACGAGVMP